MCLNFFLRLTFLLEAALLCFACNSSREVNQKLDLYRIKVKIGNDNPYDIGYKIFPDSEEIISVNSICITDNEVLLLDPIHRNIKLINIKTKLVAKISREIPDDRLSDLYLFDGMIYVCSFSNIVYVFDLSLKLISNLKVESPYGEKRFFKYNGDLYLNTYATENWQDEKFIVYAVASRLKQLSTVSRDTIIVGHGFEAYENLIMGFAREEGINMTCFSNDEAKMCLNEIVPRIPYEGKNIYFSERFFGFFTFNSSIDSLELYVNNYH